MYGVLPLLWALGKLVVKPDIGRILACADDIAAAMRRLDSLVRMAELFGLFQMISGLTLHPGRCVLVLTSAQTLPQVVAAIRFWHHHNIPQMGVDEHF